MFNLFTWLAAFTASAQNNLITNIANRETVQGNRIAWVLNDFRSPKRSNEYQDGWNRKGFYDDQCNKKKAYYIMKAYYNEKEKAANLNPKR